MRYRSQLSKKVGFSSESILEGVLHQKNCETGPRVQAGQVRATSRRPVAQTTASASGGLEGRECGFAIFGSKGPIAL